MIRRACVVTLLALPMTFGMARADDVKDLEGTWIPSDATNAGEKMAEDFIKSVTLKLNGTKYDATIGEIKETGKFTLDSKKKPKTMDITPTDGPNKDKLMLAIYELDGDTLKVCYTFDGKTRPTEFKSTPENKWFLVTYKRKK